MAIFSVANAKATQALLNQSGTSPPSRGGSQGRGNPKVKQGKKEDLMVQVDVIPNLPSKKKL